MGTRHVISIYKDGEFKLAQYGQWDGSPTHQGSDILRFLARADLEALSKGVDRLFYATDDELESLYETVGVPRGSEWMNASQAARLKELFPTIQRDLGAGILPLLADPSTRFDHGIEGKEGMIPTSDFIQFIGEPWCEWAYVIDLDEGTFETYRCGSGQDDEPTRFNSILIAGTDDDTSFPRLVGSFSVYALPTRDEYVEGTYPDGLERERAYLAELAAAELDKDPGGPTMSP